MQRVAVARAPVMSPAFLFTDEPAGNLDSKNGQIILDFFQRINRELKTTIVMVTHDRDFAALASKRITLADGTIKKE